MRAINSLESELTELLESYAIPGLGMVILDNGLPDYSIYCGYAKIASRIPVSAHSVFEAASLTKPLFATAVFNLIESGQLDLDAPLDRYLPAPYLPDEPRSRMITARLALSHTTGLPNWAESGEPLRLEFSPGQRFAYSGEGYVYLQKVVEQLCGLPIETWLQANLLEPLGLAPDQASLVWQAEYDQTCATAYNANLEPAQREKAAYGNVAYTLRCTPFAYARFLTLFLSPEAPGSARLSPKVLADMLTPVTAVRERGRAGQPATEPIPGLSWGLGWGLSDQGQQRLFWQWGDNEVFHALAVGDPGTGRGLVAMTNSQSGYRLWPAIVSRIFGEPHPLLVWLQRYRP